MVFLQIEFEKIVLHLNWSRESMGDEHYHNAPTSCIYHVNNAIHMVYGCIVHYINQLLTCAIKWFQIACVRTRGTYHHLLHLSLLHTQSSNPAMQLVLVIAIEERCWLLTNSFWATADRSRQLLYVPWPVSSRNTNMFVLHTDSSLANDARMQCFITLYCWDTHSLSQEIFAMQKFANCG